MKTDRAPSCPRCGYDQSGAVAAWGESCPVRGVCSECGLEFAWVDVFKPERVRVRGFFEHARGFWESVSAVPRTAWLVGRPWRFWGRVRMHMKPRAGRAVMWAVLFVVAVYVALGAMGTADVVLNGLAVSQGRRTWRAPRGTLMESVLSAWGEPLWTLWGPSWEPGHVLGSWIVLLVVATAIWPVSFLLLPQTRRRAKVRGAHVRRGVTYSSAWLAIVLVPYLLYYLAMVFDDACWLMGLDWPWLVRALQSPVRLVFTFPLGFAMVLWLWLALWWFFAIRRGFRLQHAWGVWAALAAINALGTAMAASAWMIFSVIVLKEAPELFRIWG